LTVDVMTNGIKFLQESCGMRLHRRLRRPGLLSTTDSRERLMLSAISVAPHDS